MSTSEQTTFAAAGAVDNPDQRICDDVTEFAETSVKLTIGVVGKLFQMAAFSGVLWSRLPKDLMTERQISQTLTRHHHFGDPAILRRTLCELHLVARTPDVSTYQRLERPPPPEARALITALQPRLISPRRKYSTGGDGGA